VPSKSNGSSSVHNRRMTVHASARLPTEWAKSSKGRPCASYSRRATGWFGREPAPMPMPSRPPDTMSTVAAILASTAGRQPLHRRGQQPPLRRTSHGRTRHRRTTPPVGRDVRSSRLPSARTSTRRSEYIRCISGIDAPLPASDWASDLRSRLDGLLDEYRTALHASLDGLTEDEAQLRLVPSKTTLLGLVKHVTYVEGVWFDQAINGRSYAEIGIPNSPDRSFMVSASDTIASVQHDHRLRCAASRRAMADLPLDAVVHGRGDRPVWALLLQVLRELAQHAGHADILRDQVLARRPTSDQ
jgi:hypothetical protein